MVIHWQPRQLLISQCFFSLAYLCKISCEHVWTIRSISKTIKIASVWETILQVKTCSILPELRMTHENGMFEQMKKHVFAIRNEVHKKHCRKCYSPLYLHLSVGLWTHLAARCYNFHLPSFGRTIIFGWTRRIEFCTAIQCYTPFIIHYIMNVCITLRFSIRWVTE